MKLNSASTPLPVSKKVYSDISSRLQTALSFSPDSAAEAKKLMDSYLQGDEPQSEDQLAMVAFNMIKTELAQARERSRRARQRAAERRSKNVVADLPTISEILTSFNDMVQNSSAEEMTNPRKLNRRERREIERGYRREEKRRNKMRGKYFARG